MKFTNVSGEARDLPSLNLVGIQPDAEFDVDGDAAEQLLTDPAFKRVGKPTDPPDKPTHKHPAKTEEK